MNSNKIIDNLSNSDKEDEEGDLLSRMIDNWSKTAHKITKSTDKHVLSSSDTENNIINKKQKVSDYTSNDQGNKHDTSIYSNLLKNNKFHYEDLDDIYEYTNIIESNPNNKKTTSKTKKKKRKEKKKKYKNNNRKFSLDEDEQANDTDKEQEKIKSDIVEYEPVMLPEEMDEYIRSSNEDMKEIGQFGRLKNCKLCDLGDNNTTKLTTEALKGVFEVERKLYRRVPDAVIYRLQCEKWHDDIVLPNKDLGINIDKLTETEARRHYEEFHDLTNIQRILWSQIVFILRSMNHYKRRGGIWETRKINGIPEDGILFNGQCWTTWSKMAKQCGDLISLATKLNAQEEDGRSDLSGAHGFRQKASNNVNKRNLINNKGSKNGQFTPY
jgi:hypothetical protein